MNARNKEKIKPLVVLLLAVFLGVIAYPKETGWPLADKYLGKLKINMGLDLQGGVHLVYEADMSGIEKDKEKEALSGIQDVIERRVNSFGVAEPVIQPSKVGNSYRLIVELAGVKDVEDTKDMIKETPFLEFKKEEDEKKELSPEEQQKLDQQLLEAQKQLEESGKKAQEILNKALQGENFEQLAKDNSTDPGSKEQGGDLGFFGKGKMDPEFEKAAFEKNFPQGSVYPQLVKSQFGFHVLKKIEERGEGDQREVRAAHILVDAPNPEQIKSFVTQQLLEPDFISTGLTGKDLKRSQVNFNPQTGKPEVALQFNDSGRELFKNITEENVGKRVAIYLDGEIISAPVVNDVIRNGEAVISGGFSTKEAQDLSRRLNAGALPVPIRLISQQSVEASLGKASLESSIKAGLLGFAAIAVFMVFYYRIAGLVAIFALGVYTALMISLFKFSSLSQVFSVTLTLSGIAGFILSIGMAVDANILIFERTKEEIRRGRDLKRSIEEGFRRAWTSIRDGNYSTIITCLILMIFGSGFVKGFAIILTLGILASMFTAIVVTRILLKVFSGELV